MTSKPRSELRRIDMCLLEHFASSYPRMRAIMIDGGTATGKTTLAAYFKSLYALASRRVQVISMDWFLQPRASRLHLYEEFRAGQISIEAYHNGTWNLDRYDNCVRNIGSALLERHEQTMLLDGIADRRSGKSVGAVRITLSPATVLILEGTGITHPDRLSLPGPRIWIEAPPIETIIERKFQRALEREHSIRRSQVAKMYRSVEALHDSWISSICRSRADWWYESKYLFRTDPD